MVTITEIDPTTPDYPTENSTNPNITGHTSNAHSFHNQGNRRNPNFQSQGSRILRQDFDSNITCPNCHTNIHLSHNHNHDPTVPHRDVYDEIPTIPLAQPNLSHQPVVDIVNDKKVLLKYDVTIFESDMDSLFSWLSDAIINFSVMHLYENLSDHLKNIVTIVPSTSCDIIKYDPSGQLPEILANLNVTPEKWCFFAFNNNSNLGHYGGSHWSLLVYDPRRKHCALVDSMYDGVPPLIQEFSKKILRAFNLEIKPVKCRDCPKMKFGGDCGIYLIEYLESILKNLEQNQQPFTFAKMLDEHYMSTRRNHWYNIIMALASKEQPFETKSNPDVPENIPSSTSFRVKPTVTEVDFLPGERPNFSSNLTDLSSRTPNITVILPRATSITHSSQGRHPSMKMLNSDVAEDWPPASNTKTAKPRKRNSYE